MPSAHSDARVLVTGGLGVNGVWAVRALLEDGATVLVTDLQPDFDLAPDLAGAVEFAPLDVTDAAAVQVLMRSFAPSVVAHLAALLPVQVQDRPRHGYAVNVMGTANVLEASRDAGVRRVVYTSSKAAYGAITGACAHPRYESVAETRPSQPVALYDYAKLAGEGLGIAYARAGGPEFAALRFATIYGPGKLVRHGPMSLVSRLVEDAHFGRETIIEFGADERDDLLYVRDAGRAVSQVALAGGALGHHVYNVGTGRGVTLDEVAAVVRSARPGARIEIGPGLDPMRFGVPYYGVMDATRLAEELGFRAAFDIDAGVADYLQRLGPAPPGDGAR